MGNKSNQSTSNRQEDRRAAAQDDGVAISGDTGGDIIVDMVPDELIDLVQNTTTGAADLVSKAVGAVNNSQQTVKEIAANTQPNGAVIPLLMAGVAAVWLWRR